MTVSDNLSVHFDAVILAGGRGSRLGGVDKASIELQGERLVDRVARAASAAGAARTIVVGPNHTRTSGGLSVREDPPFQGPLAATAAGLQHVEAPWVMLLACDLVDPTAACQLLVHAASTGPLRDGVMLEDPEGRAQWLAGVYSTARMREALAKIGPQLSDLPIRTLFTDCTIRRVPAESPVTQDIDDQEDLQAARYLGLRSHERMFVSQHDAAAGISPTDAFKEAFRTHPAGIAIIAATSPNGPAGITASSVASVGLDPLALSFSVTTSGGSAGQILQAESYIVHLLSAENVDVAMHFATHGADRFTPEQGWRTLATGEPHLAAAQTALRCRTMQVIPVGESSLVLAEVLEVLPGTPGAPVVYVDRTFHQL